MKRHSDRKEIDHHGSKLYCPILIKETIQWFPFLSIMEHAASNIEKDISRLPSLLKVFEIFQMRLLYYEHNEK